MLSKAFFKLYYKMIERWEFHSVDCLITVTIYQWNQTCSLSWTWLSRLQELCSARPTRPRGWSSARWEWPTTSMSCQTQTAPVSTFSHLPSLYPPSSGFPIIDDSPHKLLSNTSSSLTPTSRDLSDHFTKSKYLLFGIIWWGEVWSFLNCPTGWILHPIRTYLYIY